jgi:diguanylate cyclase (GGDEF)-like protein/PAS domain S-box-containing protein
MNIKVEHKVILLSVMGAILLWVVDSFFDLIYSQGQSFQDIFLNDISPHELYTRIFFFISFILLGLLASRLIGRLKRVEAERENFMAEEKRIKEKIEQTALFLNTIFDSIRDPFIILDSDYKIIKANQAYSDLKNIIMDDLIGGKCYALTRNRDSICDNCIVAKTFSSGDPSAKEKKVVSGSGSHEWLEIYTYPIMNQEGVVTHVIEYVRNITDRKRAEEESQRFIKELETLSSEDSLTGLLNRRMIFERIRHEIERVRRYRAELSLIFCDLDNFKEINDTYGHKAGDEVLRTIADILKLSVRTSDVVGRYGGDEFLLILPQTSLKRAQELAERIRIVVQDTKFVMPGNKSAGITMSIGVAFYDGAETDVDALLNRIDTALYVSKRSGKNQVYSLV